MHIGKPWLQPKGNVASDTFKHHELNVFFLVSAFHLRNLKWLFLPSANIIEPTFVASRLLSGAGLSPEFYQVKVKLISTALRDALSNRKKSLVWGLFIDHTESVQYPVNVSIHRKCVIISKRKQKHARSGLVTNSIQTPKPFNQLFSLNPAQASFVEFLELLLNFPYNPENNFAFLVRYPANFNQRCDFPRSHIDKRAQVRIGILKIRKSSVAVYVIRVLREDCCDEKIEGIRQFGFASWNTKSASQSQYYDI